MGLDSLGRNNWNYNVGMAVDNVRNGIVKVHIFE